MVDTLARPHPPLAVPPGRRRRVAVMVTVVAAVVVVAVAYLVVEWGRYTKSPPTFPSLATAPDPSLKGTVAYVVEPEPNGGPPAQRCVWIVDASGQPAKSAWCLPQSEAAGPWSLAWQRDGRLQITAFRGGEPSNLVGVWARLIDVRAGSVENVPQAQVPAKPSAPPPVAAAPDGQRATATSKSGHVTVKLSGSSGERTLLSATGGSQYRLAYNPVWSPDWDWLLVNDGEAGRLLLVTTGSPSSTRVLATHVASQVSADIPQYAVTGPLP